MRIPRLALVAYVLAVAVVVTDQAAKYWFLSAFHLPDCRVTESSETSAQVSGLFALTKVCNHGVSFGVLNSDADWTRWALSAFALAVAGALAVWATRVRHIVLAFAVGFIMGGAVGNLIDRVRMGAVVDFLDFNRLHFPWVFNVADAAINIGAVLLVWDLFLAPRKRAGD